jgi:hypothetical protein
MDLDMNENKPETNEDGEKVLILSGFVYDKNSFCLMLSARKAFGDCLDSFRSLSSYFLSCNVTMSINY